MTLGLAAISSGVRTTTRTQPLQCSSAHLRCVFHCRLTRCVLPFSVGPNRDRYVAHLSSRTISSSHIATTTVAPSWLIADPPKCRRERAAPKCSKQVDRVQVRFISLPREPRFSAGLPQAARSNHAADGLIYCIQFLKKCMLI